MDAVDNVVDSTDRLLTVLGRATAEFNRSRNAPVWVDDLMLVAKDLVSAVEHGLRPFSASVRVSERERRQRGSSG